MKISLLLHYLLLALNVTFNTKIYPHNKRKCDTLIILII